MKMNNMKKKTLIRKLLEDYPDLTQEQIADLVGSPRQYVTKIKNEEVSEYIRWGLTEEDVKLLDVLKHPELYTKELNR